MSPSRRQVLGTLGVLAAGAGIGAVAWPRRRRPVAREGGACPALAGQQIRWIVPHAAGGGYDTESRLIERFLEPRLAAEIVVENLTGAGGIAGARTIASAPPDGRTVGFVGAPGLLVSKLTGMSQTLDPAMFTILGRASRSWHVWATGRNSPITTFDEALAASRRKPLVVALSEVASVNFVSAGVTAAILGAPISMVPGFEGSQAAGLAALRGDVDLVSFDFEAIRNLIHSGDLRPLLQVSDRPADAHAALAGVPLLSDVSKDKAVTTALIEVIAAGRIVVAPPGLDPSVTACLGNTLHDTLMSAELRAATTRSLDVATGEVARADVLAAERDLPLLRTPLETALAAVRG